MTKKTFLAFAVIFTLLFTAWGSIRIVKSVSFSTNCTQYLKRAADANSVEMAKEELEKAIFYAESKNLTHGRVSIFLNQPVNDIGYWYENMKVSYEELENLPDDSSPLEKTNVLMKLRETLTDSSDGSLVVTMPMGISIYPYNVSYFWWGIISSIGAILFWILLLIAYVEDWD